MPELNVLNQKITYIKIDDEDYISITDMLKSKDGDFFVFVEVKYRRDASFGYPSEAVDRKKQQKIRKTAVWYLKVHHPSDFAPVRFDVVEILGKKIRVIKNAF